MRVAIVYDRVVKWGGAERVLLALNELFPNAPLYTAVYNPSAAPWAAKFSQVIPSFINKIPRAKRNHEKLALLMPHAFESFDFSGYDLVISVTSEAAKGIVTGPKTRHVCYCLTPTRYLWSHYDDYFSNSTLRLLSKPAVNHLKRWDVSAAQRPDVMIAISTQVKARIKKYYGRESEVIFPPVDLALSVPKKQPSNNFYLLVSRLVPYKKVDLAVSAFNELGLPLVIVGTGSQEKKLKEIAEDNIIFTGSLTDDELANYYINTRALVFPQNEDFGIVAVEAQLAGKPVIALQAGGALDTVTEQTGIFFKKQRIKDLANVVKEFEKKKFDSTKIMKNGKRFSKAKFQKKILEIAKSI